MVILTKRGRKSAGPNDMRRSRSTKKSEPPFGSTQMSGLGDARAWKRAWVQICTKLEIDISICRFRNKRNIFILVSNRNIYVSGFLAKAHLLSGLPERLNLILLLRIIINPLVGDYRQLRIFRPVKMNKISDI